MFYIADFQFTGYPLDATLKLIINSHRSGRCGNWLPGVLLWVKEIDPANSTPL